MEEQKNRLFVKPDGKTAVRITLMAMVFTVLIHKLFGQYYENPAYLLCFVIAFVLTLFFFHRIPSDDKPGLFERRSVLSLFLLTALGYNLLFRIWDDMDYGSISLIVLFIIYASELFRFPKFQDLFKKLVFPEQELIPDESKNRRGFTEGLLFTTACLILLEIRQPYFFTGDDNLVQFLPDIILGVKSVFAGKIPAWNPHQHLGIPLLDQGIYALTYIPTYISYFIAKNLLGSENLTIEVFAFIHIIAGYITTYFLLRRFSVGGVISSAGSAAFVLSGFTLMAGRSWFYMLPVTVYLPAFVWMTNELINGKPGLKWIIGSGLIIGFFFHAGNAQMWVYGLLFIAIPLILTFLLEKLQFSRFIMLGAAVAIGLAIASPLAIPQFLVTKDLVRGTWGGGVLQGLAAFIFPYPICRADHPNGWASDGSNAQIYYSGTLFFLIAYLMFFFMLLYKTEITEMVRKNIWLFTGFVAFIFGLGKSGILWNLFSKLPIFSKFTNPFKFLPLINLFVIIGTAVVLERLFKHIKDNGRYQKIITISVFVLLLWHCLTPLNAFYMYADKPFGRLPDEVLKIIKTDDNKDYRIVNISEQDVFYTRSDMKNFHHFAGFNYPTVSGLYSAGGYEPFAIDSPLYSHVKKAIKEHKSDNDFNLLRSFGVKWIFAYEQKCIEESDNNPNLKRVYKFPGQEIAIYELLNTNPVVFASKNPSVPLKVYFDTEGADIETSGIAKGDEVCIGVLYRPGFYLSAGNTPVSLDKDEIGRIKFRMPVESPKVRLTYRSPWDKGLAASGIFIILSVLLTILSMYILSVENRSENIKTAKGDKI